MYLCACVHLQVDESTDLDRSDLDTADPLTSDTDSPSSSNAAGSSGGVRSSDAPQAEEGGLVRKGKGRLRRYVESFDQSTMIEMARMVTSEGAALVERQCHALFGDLKALQAEMQAAVGQDAESVEELMSRVQV